MQNCVLEKWKFQTLMYGVLDEKLAIKFMVCPLPDCGLDAKMA